MPQRFSALDGWRGIAALMVALYHFPPIYIGYDLSLIRHSWLYVDLFFVLSGFVIMHTYGAHLSSLPDAFSFMRKRFFRLYPLHFFTFASFAFLIAIDDSLRWFASRFTANIGAKQLFLDFTPLTISKHLLLLQGFSSSERVGFNMPSWSISVEFLVYGVFAVSLLLISKGRTGVQLAAAAFFVAWYAVMPSSMSETWGNFFRCTSGFFSGVAIYSLVNYVRAMPRPRLLFTGLEVGSILGLTGYMVFARSELSMRLAPVVFCLIIFLYSLESGAVSGLLKTRPFQAAGLYSYSIYMVHSLVIFLMKPALGFLKRFGAVDVEASILQGYLAVLIYLAVVWAFARWTYRMVEVPGQRPITAPPVNWSSITQPRPGAGLEQQTQSDRT